MNVNPQLFKHPKDILSFEDINKSVIYKILWFLYSKVVFTEEDLDVIANSTYVKASEDVYANFYHCVSEISKEIGIDVPEVYIGEANKLVMGVVTDKVYLLVSSMFFMTYPPELYKGVIGRELITIMSQDIKPRTMASIILEQLQMSTNFFVKLLSKGLIKLIQKNASYNELTSDRTMLLYSGNLEEVIDVIYRERGLFIEDASDKAKKTLMEQMDLANEKLKDYHRLNKMIKYGMINSSTSLAPERIKEITEWSKTEEYHKFYNCLHDPENTVEFPFPYDKHEVEKQDVNYIIEKLKGYMFNNITVKESPCWNSNLDGKIKDIIVNGSSDFKKGDWFDKDIPVELTVHRKKQ